MAELFPVLADLDAESGELDALVAALPPTEWHRTTPAEGWTVAHQIAHLAWTDETALAAIGDTSAFASEVDRLLCDGTGYVDQVAAERATLPPDELLAQWRTGRAALATALTRVPDGTKLPWFGPPMSATSMATARLMETWAHGQDIADAVGALREPSDRLRNVAHIGVRTRDFAFQAHELEPPTAPFSVELAAPSGGVWTWGPADAAQRVTGPALDFCLLATQRRHRDDLAVEAVGADADRWLDIVQAFAGPPGAGRAPLADGLPA